MGAAAEHRGNALISRQCAERDRPVEFDLMDELNALTKTEGAGLPFGPLRFTHGHGGWWAECPVTGFGYWYPTLRLAVRSWRVIVCHYDGKGWLSVPIKH